jgi:hypothetical protein
MGARASLHKFMGGYNGIPVWFTDQTGEDDYNFIENLESDWERTWPHLSTGQAWFWHSEKIGVQRL